ncbi:MAG: glycosyltransferase family 2 protein [Bacteroidales bacterium]|nr:glycosyltransferase family 2 protein [Bacteroidales bacterium]
MISICIPIYNFNVSPLLDELSMQMEKAEASVELILIDDCSSSEYKELNKSVCNKHRYIELEENIGRAKIRNLFLDHAQYDHLLFLDCDSLIPNKTFLSNYLKAIKKGESSIICGGRIYDSAKPDSNKLLRWKYGIERESLSYEERKQQPNKSFMTNNFLISKQLLQEIKFDERLSEYGHEDTLFGFELKKKGIEINHIENPVLNGHLENNAEYLKKTEKSIHNLIAILDYVNYDPDFIQDVSLLNFYSNPSTKKLIPFIKIFFPFLKPFIKFFLINGFISIRLFSFYKLGILIQGIRNHKI